MGDPGEMFAWPYHVTELVFRYLTSLFSKQSLHWLFLVSALLIAFAVFIHSKRRAGRFSPGSFLRFCFPASVYLHRSAIIDYCHILVEPFLSRLVIGPAVLMFALAFSFDGTRAAMQNWWGEPTWRPSHPALLILFAPASIVVYDFAAFLQHYLMHKSSFLWEFHKIHHSAEVLTPLTAFRVHPVDWILMVSMPNAILGVFQGISAYFLASRTSLPTIMGINLLMFMFLLAGVHLRHSHIWLSYGPFFSRVFISPAQHQIHHSSAVKHFDKNLGCVFAVWDWYFGTLYVPREREEIDFGLSGGEHKDYSNLWRLYLLPFSKNIASKSLSKTLLTFLLIAVLTVFAGKSVMDLLSGK